MLQLINNFGGTVVALVIVAIVAVLVLVISQKGSSSSSVGSYKRRALMTQNEKEFFDRLIAAVPECYVFPQVSMIALLDAASADKKVAYRDRLRVAQQRVDYLICNRKLAIVLVVELDDKTHSAQKDKVRDQRLLQAGIRTVRFQSKNKPDVEALREAIIAGKSGGQSKEGAVEPVPVASL